MIPSDHLRTLRNDVPVLSVIHTLRIPTKKRGARLTFRCPNCQRFYTATKATTNLARCFSCERNFNPIDLVMAERGWSFLQAVNYLEENSTTLGGQRRFTPDTPSTPPRRAGSQLTRRRAGSNYPSHGYSERRYEAPESPPASQKKRGHNCPGRAPS